MWSGWPYSVTPRLESMGRRGVKVGRSGDGARGVREIFFAGLSILRPANRLRSGSQAFPQHFDPGWMAKCLMRYGK
jgi:hypothetical protein